VVFLPGFLSCHHHAFRFGTDDVENSLNAGLDLEMPGVNKWRIRDYITNISRSIKAQKVTAEEG
jgi:hypothetical protein